MTNKKILYIDMDGVLCDFDSKAAMTPKHVKDKYGDNLHRVPGFYRDLQVQLKLIKNYANITMFILLQHQVGVILHAG